MLYTLVKLPHSVPKGKGKISLLKNKLLHYFNFLFKTFSFYRKGNLQAGPNFPEKTSVFPAGQKIVPIFCPKGGLAVVPLNNRTGGRKRFKEALLD
jgi:hypothetical protein